MLCRLRIISSCALLILLGAPAFAQKPKNPEKAPEYSDADKKKIAEIEQRPEIKDEIAKAWDDKRSKDLDYIYNVNASARFGDISGPQFAEFRTHYGQLYNNPMLQRYINSIGQRLVPKDSPNTYSFKLLLDPVPRAEAYSTGTVLVTTGLVSMLDNEAQLAYVLGHEVAHVEKNHQYDLVRMSVLEPALNTEKKADAEKKRAIFTAVASVAGAGIGAAANGASGALIGAFSGLGAGLIGSSIFVRDHTTVTEWSDLYENEADAQSLQYMLDQSYDVREAPRLYARLQTATGHDPRIGIGFIANPTRMTARTAHIQALLTGDLKEKIDAKLKANGLTGSSGEFSLIMAALKRDNGIVAIDYDLFDMARDNLEEAVNLRSNDPRAQLYLGKVISLTARTPQDRQAAEGHFLKAIEYDQDRGAYPDPHLEHALHLLGENGDKSEINHELQAYIALYQREHTGAVPPNIDILYDYLTLVGDTNWYAAPSAIVSTRNVEALRTSTGTTNALTAPEVIAAATGATPAQATVQPAVETAPATEAKPKPVVHRTGATAPKQ